MRVLILFALFVPAIARAEIPPGAFVRTDGARFVVGGRPFAFVGANLEVVQGGRNREKYRATISALAKDGLTVGRVWAFGEGPADAKSWYLAEQLFRAGPDGFVEESYAQLDKVLAAARADGVRLIVALANNWASYGGVPAYLRWAGLPDDAIDSFYTDERARALYRAGVEKLLARVNRVTGVAYVDDPTIFSWELMNESSVDTPEGVDARRSWIVEMALLVKARDPHHLVGAGVQGYRTLAERAEWIRVHRLPEIDYCDSHLYPQTDGTDSWRRLADAIDDRAQLAHHVIGKPLVVGEFGFRTDGGAWLGQSRAAWYARVLDRLALDGVAGALAWIYQPWPDFARDFGIYVDRPDTDDVRRALQTRAARVSARAPEEKNPRLSFAHGDQPLYDPFPTVRGPGLRARWIARDGGWALSIPPDEFVDARFEYSGAWSEGALFHVYGVGGGRFAYRFPSPAKDRSADLNVRVRLSSEWPGSGPKTPRPDGGSTVTVRLDGDAVGTVAAITDDGVGTVHALSARPRARPVHTLTFEVDERSHGLCIYGRPTGKRAPPVGDTPNIELFWTRP